VLLDIFEKSLKDIKALSESTLKKTNITILNSLKALLTENIQGLGEKVNCI
jgi:DNA anti-recombination protein RmuC